MPWRNRQLFPHPPHALLLGALCACTRSIITGRYKKVLPTLYAPTSSSSSPAVPSSIYAAMRQRINMRQIIMQGNLILMLPNLVAVAAAAQHCEHLRSPCGGSIVCQAGNILPHLGLPLIAISMIIITIYSQTIAAGK